MGDLNMVRVAGRAAQIAQDANAAYWFSCTKTDDGTERHLRGTIDGMFRELADALGYTVTKREPLPSIAANLGDV